ncbi:MAG: hypothetical protein B6D77_16005 [gamma proteobacterium symbiont of Ctena orbiculata]|nr:MAG: hypothetical protein B6D77_16005 [gamma proteobacterium symbiont of Ctena orbiculata]PVV22359.1 MAG: hypothetical protein B6D78_05250 [gamma proteobacterium symbiont of Ctena orbiculata]
MMRLRALGFLFILMTGQVVAVEGQAAPEWRISEWLISQHHCPFCVRLKQEIIHPMRISGDYEDKVVITEILLDSDENIRDFKGASVSPGAIADSYRVWVTPTLLFLDHTGREVHKRMLGVNTIEMYSYYLDASLAASLRAVHTGDRGYVLTKDDISGDAPGYDQLY